MKLSLQFLINAAHTCVTRKKISSEISEAFNERKVNDHTKLSFQFLINAAHKCATRKKISSEISEVCNER